ncbi:hypothetical protein HEK616_17440 [Streptomyces nigrescens]|uniref:Secreted protein n=1 Tax=Streptomyces nigrescens TaxID=1920 RepID=A0ABM7ZPD6_STRNI|nr:hypothetical protein [Streptomyces nigrescens]BDM68257.1 hypothetical protein HEK616_17440 [Streptomyces nigrescens]
MRIRRWGTAVAAALLAVGGLVVAGPASAADQDGGASAPRPPAGHWARYDTFSRSLAGRTECRAIGEAGRRQGRWPAYSCDSGVFTTYLAVWVP